MNHLVDVSLKIIKETTKIAQDYFHSRIEPSQFAPLPQDVSQWINHEIIKPKTKKHGYLQHFRSHRFQDFAFMLAFFRPFMRVHLQHRTFKAVMKDGAHLYTPDFYIEYETEDGSLHKNYIDLIEDDPDTTGRHIPTVPHEIWCKQNHMTYLQVSPNDWDNLIEDNLLENIRMLSPYRFFDHPCLTTGSISLMFQIQDHFKSSQSTTFGELCSSIAKNDRRAAFGRNMDDTTAHHIIESLIKLYIAKGRILTDFTLPFSEQSSLILRSATDKSCTPFYEGVR